MIQNENVDIYATPIPKENRVNTPKIHVSADSSSGIMDDSSNKLQALVIVFISVNIVFIIVREAD